ncbi:MAG TPA: LuxR C-terminal-related transcriptional regulator [Terriglobales bacterium]|nr:LuxR C-terminal-related transcriptional regulator [Terriglobales bacterium]
MKDAVAGVRALAPLLALAERQGFAREDLLQGTGITEADLKDLSGWLPWEKFCLALDNFAKIWNDEQLFFAGGDFIHSKPVLVLDAIWIAAAPVRLLLSPERFFRRAFGNPDSLGLRIFPHMGATFRDFERGVALFTLEAPVGHRCPPAFFHIARGAMTMVPRLAGFPPAHVVMELKPDAASYSISFREAPAEDFVPQIAPELVDALRIATQQLPKAEVLTAREEEIVRLVVQGFSTKEIAKKLAVSTRTVDAHRANIAKKTHSESPADLIRYAFRTGLVE